MPKPMPVHESRLDAASIATLRRRVLDFYDEEGRDLPWRRNRSPYGIWISEVMSQQTRIDTVVPYWHAWMEAFPDVESLADAEEEAVLKSWEGLGYYSRARNLHRAARTVRETLGGALPTTRDGLRDLPGIGAYTAGAVASIAFGEAVPAVDGNVRRVAARVLDWPEPTAAGLEAEVSRWVPEDRPGDFNQALMELGATVCTPRLPRCGDCPVASLCRARAAGTVAERPAPRKRGPVRTAAERVIVAWRPGGDGVELALRQRPAKGLLGGMYEFPGTPAVEAGEPVEARDPEGPTTEDVGHRGGLENGIELPPVVHLFSHIRMTYRPVLLRWDRAVELPEGARWVGTEELAGLPLPVAQQSILAHARAALSRSPGSQE